jgi:uncharacterized protein (DUF1697 family)
MTHVALLRGINVGGKAKLPMNELAAIFTAAGAHGVRTYIQSGNVVFEADAAEPVVEAVTRQIATSYGYPGRIVLRSADEMRKAYARNPFAGAPLELLHVYFLADMPAAAAIKALDSERSPGDSFAVVGREVYLHMPQGMARTKLTNAYFDKKLKTVSTARNWNTVGKLVEMIQGDDNTCSAKKGGP